MNYNSFLDTWFGNGWYSYGIPFLLFLLGIFYLESKKRNNGKKRKRSYLRVLLYQAVLMIIVFLNSLINPMYMGYGPPRGIKEIRYTHGKLVILDYLSSLGSRGGKGILYYRIHIVDAQTGKKERRFHVGAGADIFGIHKDFVGIRNFPNSVSYYSITTGKRIKKFDKISLPKLFNDLSMGVNNITVKDDETIGIQALDGNNWILYPYNDSLVKSPTSTVTRHKVKVPVDSFMYLDDSEIIFKSGTKETTLISLENNYGDGRNQLHDSNDSIVYKDQFFLSGYIYAISIHDSTFIVYHNETMKKEKFILSCFKIDGSAKLWEIKMSSLNPNFVLKGSKAYTYCYTTTSNQFFFNVSKEMFAIDMKDGKIQWRVKL